MKAAAIAKVKKAVKAPKRGRPMACKVAKEPKKQRAQPQTYEQLKTNGPPNPRVAHQKAVYDRLIEEGIEFKHESQVYCVKTQGKYYMVDFVIEKPWGLLIVECDEHAHWHNVKHAGNPRAVVADPVRDLELQKALDCKQLVVLRWNPDEYRVDKELQGIPMKTRLDALVRAIREYKPEEVFERRFMFYNEWTKTERYRGKPSVIFDPRYDKVAARHSQILRM